MKTVAKQKLCGLHWGPHCAPPPPAPPEPQCTFINELISARHCNQVIVVRSEAGDGDEDSDEMRVVMALEKAPAGKR